MKREKRINGIDFKEVKEIPCSTDLRGKVLTDCYKKPSDRKIEVFKFWETWKSQVNTGFYARITSMWISAYTCNFFTLVFKGYTLPEERKFTIAVTANNHYIKYERAGLSRIHY